MNSAPWWQVVRQDAARLIVKISGSIPAKDDGLCALLARTKVAEIVVRLDSTAARCLWRWMCIARSRPLARGW